MTEVRIRIVTDIPPGGEWWQGILGTTVVVPVQEVGSDEYVLRVALYMTPDDVRTLVARLNEALEKEKAPAPEGTEAPIVVDSQLELPGIR